MIACVALVMVAAAPPVRVKSRLRPQNAKGQPDRRQPWIVPSPDTVTDSRALLFLQRAGDRFGVQWRCRRRFGSQGSQSAMTVYFVLKYLHVLGAIIILGTGTGIAFFMLMAHRSGNVAFIAQTAATVVIADILFTATAVVLQPLTGAALMSMSSTSLWEPWLVTAIALYGVAGLFWIPVVFMQIELRDLASRAAASGEVLPPRYFTLYRRWFLFGIPGFGSVMVILWLMIAKPL